MKFQLVTKALADAKSECLVLPIFEDVKPQLKDDLIGVFLKDNPKFGKLYSSQLLYSKSSKLLLVGAGNSKNLDFGKYQNWVGTAVKTLLKKTKSISIVAPKTDKLDAQAIGEAIAIGAEIASYDITKDYQSEHESSKLTSLEIIIDKADRGYQEGIKQGQIIAESMNLARRLGDMPPNEMTPTYFLNMAKKVARDNKLKITVLDEKMAKKKGLGAFVGVAQGSDEPSFMIALEHKGDIKSKDKWGLIGKGITFDTGGISIKPSSNMHEMKYDMCGAANVLGTMQAIAKLGVKANVVGVMAVTENLPGGKAQRPGDIVKTYSGKTAEILNTDAEGRLVLSDGLSLAQRDFKATKLVDLATLTGAMIVALGDFYTGVFGNNQAFNQELISTGNEVGEKFWELPMSEEYDEMIKSEIADITNIGHGGSMPGAAGAITGAKFIESFVENNTPWIHLDIAGTGWDMKVKPYYGIGATGIGVKTLVKLIGG